MFIKYVQWNRMNAFLKHGAISPVNRTTLRKEYNVIRDGLWGAFTRRTRAALLGALAPLALAFAPAANAIYLGTVDLGGFYSGVGMILPTTNHAACTGTMLTNTVFLTAAQCVFDQTPGANFQFSMGAGMTAHATEIRAHPGFMSPDGLSLPYDIALVALDKADVASWSGFTHWTIGTETLAPPVVVTAVGFGENDNGLGSGARRSGKLSVTQYIGAEAPVGLFIPDAFIETFPGDSQGQMFCAGDAGGPLLHNNAIVGIASFRFAANCNDPGPGYYLSLKNFSDWIDTNLSEMDPAKAVPEPTSMALLGIGIAALGFSRRKRIRWHKPSDVGSTLCEGDVPCHSIHHRAVPQLWMVRNPQSRSRLPAIGISNHSSPSNGAPHHCRAIPASAITLRYLAISALR